MFIQIFISRKYFFFAANNLKINLIIAFKWYYHTTVSFKYSILGQPLSFCKTVISLSSSSSSFGFGQTKFRSLCRPLLTYLVFFSEEVCCPVGGGCVKQVVFVLFCIVIIQIVIETNVTKNNMDIVKNFERQDKRKDYFNKKFHFQNFWTRIILSSY